MSQTPSRLERAEELSILNQIAKELNRSVDLKQALTTVLHQVARLLGLETSWIFLIDEATDESYLGASHNLPPGLAENPEMMEGRCYCLDTYRSGDLKGAANINVIGCSRLSGLVEGTGGLKYHASIPIYADEKKIGVLNVASAEWRKLTSDDLNLLNTIADLMSIAVERARLYDRSVSLGAVEERYRLARELHDTLGQDLTAILLRLETLDAKLESGVGPDALQESVRQIMSLTRDSLDEARRSVQDLRAAPLEGHSLSVALARLISEMQSRSPVTMTYDSVGASRPLPDHIEAGIYRIAQEALNNVVRHSNAGKAEVTLACTPIQLHLTVVDDGIGFDPSTIPGDRYGLKGLNERAHLLGGELNLESTEGKGTRVEVIVPLEGKE
jgi:two-component system, NarL family, sensor kinase